MDKLSVEPAMYRRRLWSSGQMGQYTPGRRIGLDYAYAADEHNITKKTFDHRLGDAYNACSDDDISSGCRCQCLDSDTESFTGMLPKPVNVRAIGNENVDKLTSKVTMQLMTDAISVFGSRHNIMLYPAGRKCFINRSGIYPGLACELIAGVTIEGRQVAFPLCQQEDGFDFLDQDMTPCKFKLTGIDEKTTIKLELTVCTPFRPRDIDFSSTPVLDIRVKLTRLDSNFRGYQASEVAEPGKIFLELKSDHFKNVTSQPGQINWSFDSTRPLHRDQPDNCRKPVLQNDAFYVHSGRVAGNRIELDYTPDDYIGKEIHVSWCKYSDALMTVNGQDSPFQYTQRFAGLDDVVAWAGKNPDVISENAGNVDGIFKNNNLGAETNHSIAQTIHSWLINTWWTKADNKDWYTVWEGNCYYLSTMDVEYTQTPFYLSVWPELLSYELDMWPNFTHSGREILGEKGNDTIVFMHDVGWLSEIDRTRYAHPMPIEQNTNYVIMHYAYWRRTGDFSVIERNLEHIIKAIDFIVLSDSTGDGVPDKGTANTIDDACPALQFGKMQVYLAVKTLACLEVGADILQQAGRMDISAAYRKQAEKTRKTIHEQGWNRDHFNMLMGVSPDARDDTANAGWDATHIYTCHGLTLLDMVGKDVGLDQAMLKQDLKSGVRRCIDKYGCRHSDYLQSRDELLVGEFGTFNCPRVGWIAMNMFRDIAAFYRGIDLRYMASKYWDFQTLVNTQDPCLFFETFSGNRLMTYPRGLAICGFFDALAGLRMDLVDKTFLYGSINDEVEVPVLLYADWKSGVVPRIEGVRLIDEANIITGTFPEVK